jgi:phage FluMu protein Com
MATDEVRCTQCGSLLNERSNTPEDLSKPCPNCGSVLRNKHIVLGDGMRVRDSLRLKAREKHKGKPFLNSKSGEELHHDSGRWHDRKLCVDRRNRTISERIVDVETGKVIKDYTDPLEKHRGHGSAKRKKRFQ